MIKWTIRVVLTIAVLVIVVAGVGWMLPQGHHASRTAALPAPPATVFALINDVARYAEWRSDVTKVDVLPDDGGGLRFREDGSNGAIVFRVEQVDAPRSFRVRIDDAGQPFGGTWTYTLTPEGSGTSLTITEDGEVYNPIFRFLSHFLFSQTATIDAYLAALQRRVSPS